MPFYEVTNKVYWDKNGARQEPGTIIKLPEAGAAPFKFRLRKLSPLEESVLLKPPDETAAEIEPDEEVAEPEPLDDTTNKRIVTVSITPSAQSLAEEEGLDWTRISGTGKDGRVILSDVQAAVEEMFVEEVFIADEPPEEEEKAHYGDA
jgi:pyruvate/2-oxoglutarate dehydrogenase complex dihydrolipoamide acyltransferase (E2) component